MTLIQILAKQMHIFDLQKDLVVILPFLFSVKWQLKILLLIGLLLLLLLIIFTTIFTIEWSNSSMLPNFKCKSM